jgi:hypothetical protein
MSTERDPARDARHDVDETEVVVHAPRLVEMTPEQHAEAVRLLAALLDARLARRRAATPEAR